MLLPGNPPAVPDIPATPCAPKVVGAGMPCVKGLAPVLPANEFIGAALGLPGFPNPVAGVCYPNWFSGVAVGPAPVFIPKPPVGIGLEPGNCPVAPPKP